MSAEVRKRTQNSGRLTMCFLNGGDFTDLDCPSVWRAREEEVLPAMARMQGNLHSQGPEL